MRLCELQNSSQDISLPTILILNREEKKLEISLALINFVIKAKFCISMGPRTKEKKKRSSFTVQEKPGMSQVKVAAKFCIKTSTPSLVLKNKQQFLAIGSSALKSKHISKGKEHDLEERLYDWFLKMRSKGVNMDRPIVGKQAEKLAETMGLETTLTFSAGWLVRWRKPSLDLTKISI